MNTPAFTVLETYDNNETTGYVVVNNVTGARLRFIKDFESFECVDFIAKTQQEAQDVADFFNGIKPQRSREAKLPELEVKCTACNGLGKTQNWETCSECNGRGVIVTAYGQHILDFVRKHK